MSIGCLIVASDTAPVREVITDGENGLLTDFFEVEQLAERVAYALENRARLGHLREAARASIQERYDLASICLPKQLEFVLGNGR
jgi:glycosyltransferase involved in cell wall biosynthesis